MKNATHLLVVVDRSGSMQSVRSDAEGAINAFIDEQKTVEGECEITLVDFDAPRFTWGAGTNDWFRTVYQGPIARASHYRLEPRGGTALYDAIGDAVTSLGQRLARLKEEQRPNNVIVVVQTDGEENSSTRFSKERIIAMLDEQQNVYNWSFVFLGAGKDTWGVGEALGFGTRVYNDGSGLSYGSTYAVASAAITESRNLGVPVAGGTTNI